MDMNFTWHTRDEKLLVVAYWWDQQGGKCCICQELMLPYKRQGSKDRDRATIEHLIPKRDGGPNTVGNVRLAHAGCNNAMGALWAVNEYRKSKGLEPHGKSWALRTGGCTRAAPKSRHRRIISPELIEATRTLDLKMRANKPMKGTLAHAVMTGEVSPDLMYVRPKPMDVKLNVQAKKMTALETARWLAQNGIR